MMQSTRINEIEGGESYSWSTFLLYEQDSAGLARNVCNKLTMKLHVVQDKSRYNESGYKINLINIMI